jgi:hypothetical protein
MVPRVNSKGAMKVQRTQNGQITLIFFHHKPPSDVIELGAGPQRGLRIPPTATHPTAKLCGMSLNIDVTNVKKDKKKIFPKVSRKCAMKAASAVPSSISVHTQKMNVRGGRGRYDFIRALL